MNSSLYDSLGMKISLPPTYQMSNMVPPEISQNYGYCPKIYSYQNIQDFQFINDRKIISMKEWCTNDSRHYKLQMKEGNISENKSENDSPEKVTNEDSKDSPKDNQNLDQSTNSNKTNINNFKEQYIDLLINSINNLFKDGSISSEYINSPTFDPKILGITLSNLNKLTNGSGNSFNKKCENKICTYLADNPHKLFYSKFFASTSYKSKNLWLCEKCYKAYASGNYCYYCNTIYREYEHGTQYYDKKKWIQCDYCQKWQHMQCEEKKGKYENIEELSLNSNFKYMCPFCRKDHEIFMRQKYKNNKYKKKSVPSINKSTHNKINNTFMHRKRRSSSSSNYENCSKPRSKK